MKQHFKAGAAAIDITPPLGTIMNGDFVQHLARSVNDNLFAKAVVFQQEERLTAIVIVDICAMPKDFIDNLKTAIYTETGIPTAHILIAATHTHFSGSVTDIFLSTADAAYKKMLPELIIKCVVNAKEKLQPARVAFGYAMAPEHVVCRRYLMKADTNMINPVTGSQDKVKTNPSGLEHLIDRRLSPVDPEVNFLAIQDIKNKWIALLANYSLHYVGDRENGILSADYFGEFSRHLAKKLDTGEDFVAMMSNGTSGDINIWDFIQPDRYPKEPHAKSTLIGQALAEKVYQAIKGLQWESNPPVSAVYKTVALNVRKANASELAAAQKIVAQTNYDNLGVYENGVINNEHIRKIYAREQVLLAQYPESIHFPVQVIRIGSGTIGALGGEFFSSTGSCC